MTGKDATAPVIDPETCSLGRLACSTCSACAAACPHAALTAEDDGLCVEPAACTGCGACLSACPQGAVTLDGWTEIEVHPAGASPTVALICPRRSAGFGPCLQALGREALARLWLGGIRQILTLTGSCSDCPDGKGLAIDARIAEMNTLLGTRGLPHLRVAPAQSVPPTMPRLMARRAGNGGRRAFLGLGSWPARTDGPRARALARLQARGDTSAARLAFAPRIDAQTCTGCDACLRICPEGALTMIKDDRGNLAYGAVSSNCTGCGLCMDICGTDAISLDRLAPTAPTVALTAFRCRSCRAEVHVPADGPHAGGDVCPVCARTGQHKRLFPVVL